MSSGKKHEMNQNVSESSERTILCQGVEPFLHENSLLEMFFGRNEHVFFVLPIPVKRKKRRNQLYIGSSHLLT
jgi:hypothetical protein